MLASTSIRPNRAIAASTAPARADLAAGRLVELLPEDTLRGLDALVRHFVPGSSVIVWVNEYFGAARYDGADFEDTFIYRQIRDKIRGLVTLRKLDPVMFAPNLAAMLERHMIFAEAAASDEFMLMEKSRLFRIKTDIWTQLATVL